MYMCQSFFYKEISCPISIYKYVNPRPIAVIKQSVYFYLCITYIYFYLNIYASVYLSIYLSTREEEGELESDLVSTKLIQPTISTSEVAKARFFWPNKFKKQFKTWPFNSYKNYALGPYN